MLIDRRTFLTLSAAGVAAGSQWARAAQPNVEYGAIKALAFDAFPVFDPRPIAQACEAAFPGRGAELNTAWRTRQFEYQWLRALGGQYQDFWQTTAGALSFAARSLNLELSADAHAKLMQHYLNLQTWPDAPAALRSLQDSGKRLIFLSNATPQILSAGIKNSGLNNVFEQVVSTDRIKSYKPDPRAYQLGVDALGLRKEEILFVAFAGWDVAGARWFGYPTFWNNRQGSAEEQLDATPTASGASLDELVRLFK